MKISDPSAYVRKMIGEFHVPASDALAECILGTVSKRKITWDSALFISTKQSERFYADIFTFWVRSFFCFIEDMQAGTLFREITPSIRCRKISSAEFRQNYLALLQQRVKSESFTERQAYPKTYIELEKRSFTDPYAILETPTIKSSVAHSDGEYVSYFVIVKPTSHVRIVQ